MSQAESFTVACVQVNAGNDMAENTAVAVDMVRQARAAGADFITTPENLTMMEHGSKETRAKAMEEGSHGALKTLSELAAELEAWLLIGSLGIRAGGNGVANRSFLVAPDGTIAGRYDKIHMFDVDLANGEVYRESESFQPGEQAVLAATPWGPLGLTVCYDVRFGHLYRALAQAGASFITVPAAFTKVTGEAHWHVLLRARAIETGCYIFAPAQCGTHPGERATFGHTLVVDPWGEVLADGGEEPGIVTARIDPAKVAAARAMIPALRHDRPYRAPGEAPDKRVRAVS